MVQERFLFCVWLMAVLFAGRTVLAMEARYHNLPAEVIERMLSIRRPILEGPIVVHDKLFSEILRMGKENYAELFENVRVVPPRKIMATAREIGRGRGYGLMDKKIMLFRYSDGRSLCFDAWEGMYAIKVNITKSLNFKKSFLSMPLGLLVVRTFSSVTCISVNQRDEKTIPMRIEVELENHPEIKELVELFFKILADKVLHSPRVGSYDFEREDVPFADVVVVCRDEID